MNQYIIITSGPQGKKTCLRGLANNKDADQPACPCNYFSAFVIRLLQSMSKLATREISVFYVVSIAERASVSMAWSETLKTGFLATRPISEGTQEHTQKSKNTNNLLSLILSEMIAKFERKGHNYCIEPRRRHDPLPPPPHTHTPPPHTHIGSINKQ